MFTSKQFIRILPLVFLFMVAVINKAQALVNIGELSKLEVSDIEYHVKRFSLGLYMGYWGKSISEREALTIRRFKQLNEQKPGEPVMVDFDAIGNHLSSAIMEAYNRLAEKDKKAMKLPPGKEQLLRDKIRHFLVITYVKNITKTYFKMKENKGAVDFCDKVDARQIRAALICMNSKADSRREYTLYMPYVKQAGLKTNVWFTFAFNRHSKTWVMNEITLNPELITDKFFLSLAYMK